MRCDTKRLRQAAGVAVTLLGVMALLVIVAPGVWGQTVKKSPLVDLTTRLSGGPVLGVEIRDVDEADVKREKLPASTGAVVENVHTDGPAAKAGVKAGDVIVSFDGERVRSARHLERLVSETPAGRTVEAGVVRSGSRMALKVTMDAADSLEPLGAFRYYNLTRPEPLTLAKPNVTYDRLLPMIATGRARLGVGVQDLTEQLGEYFGTSGGALVTAVDDGTPAKAAGIKAGDVITKINGAVVRDTNDLRRKLADASGDTTITLMRDRKELTVTAKIQDERAVVKRRVIRSF